jgi:lipase chaperone LimK
MRRAGLAIAALAGLGLWLGRAPAGAPRSPLDAPEPARSASAARAPRAAAGPALPAAVEAVARPPSLRGVALDGAIAIVDGRLVVDAALRRLFDHVLTASGELDDAGLRALVGAEARRRAPGHDREVLAAYDRYLGFLGAAQDVADDSRGAPPRAHLAQVTALQREHFGADAAAMFEVDNALALATLDRSDVLSRGDLSPADRDAALAAIEDRLPPAIRQQRARMRAPAVAREAVAEVRRRGGSEAEVHAVRVRHLGAAAADRLAALDRRRAIADH